jgi:hypothetical protein
MRPNTIKMIPRIKGKKPGASRKELYTFIPNDSTIRKIPNAKSNTPMTRSDVVVFFN